MVNLLKQIAKKFPDDVANALYAEAQIEVTEMKRRCPVDITEDAPHPGNLRASIHVERPERDGRTISVTVATGAQAPYAIYVHENPDAIHPVGEWKFMEGPIRESAPYMAQRIAARLKVDLAGSKSRVEMGLGGSSGEE
jgi:hypothetical protein